MTPRAVKETASALPEGTVDFLFIDGDHTYSGVKKDWDMYRKFLRPGSIVAFHDIYRCHNLPEIQVHKLWDELKDKYVSFEFTEGDDKRMGIGALIYDD